MKKYSIIVVSLNPGERLKQTIESIRQQTFTDYEVVVKDGGSSDGSVDDLENCITNPDYEDFAGRLHIIRQSDHGIYEGMNQAISFAEGQYLIFMNCGDYFYSGSTLEEINSGINNILERAEKAGQKEDGRNHKGIFYGNIYDALRATKIASNPHIDGFACYRNLPCHQCCIYSREMFSERKYEPKYKVRADYEHFLWSYYVKKVQPEYIDVIVASYEGAGFSETEKGRKLSAAEHKEITEKYMTKSEIAKYKAILALTLSKVRTKMAESEKFSGIYQKLKKKIYK